MTPAAIPELPVSHPSIVSLSLYLNSSENAHRHLTLSLHLLFDYISRPVIQRASEGAKTRPAGAGAERGGAPHFSFDMGLIFQHVQQLSSLFPSSHTQTNSGTSIPAARRECVRFKSCLCLLLSETEAGWNCTCGLIVATRCQTSRGRRAVFYLTASGRNSIRIMCVTCCIIAPASPIYHPLKIERKMHPPEDTTPIKVRFPI